MPPCFGNGITAATSWTLSPAGPIPSPEGTEVASFVDRAFWEWLAARRSARSKL
jgi:hypothetical protein